MGKASQAKWLRKLQAVEMVAKPPPWYESGFLWGIVSLIFAIIFTVVPTVKHDWRWLLWVAAVLTSVPLWIVVKNIISNSAWRIAVFIASLAITGWGFYEFYNSLGSAEHAQLHITRRGPIVTKQGSAARLDVYYMNRGEIDAIEVSTATAMKFVGLGSTVDSARTAETAILDELRQNLSSPNMIMGTVPPGAEYHFTILGPILEASDFSVPQGSTDTEIVRDGKLLLTAALIKYRDHYNKATTVEMCVYLDKPAPRVMNCLSGHNTETSQ